MLFFIFFIFPVEFFQSMFKIISFSEKYKNFRECLANHLSKKTKHDFKESKKIVDEGMKSYIQHYYKIDQNKSSFKQLIELIKKIFHNVRINLTQYQKLSLKKQFDLRYWNSDVPISKNQEIFEKIRNHVLNFSKFKD